MNKPSSRYLVWILLVLIIVGLPVALYLTKQNQDIRQRAASSAPVTPTPISPYPTKTTLGFSSNAGLNDISPNKTFTVKLVLESPLPVTAAQTVIQFDANKLEALYVNKYIRKGKYVLPGLDFSFGSNSEVVAANINNQLGQIKYTILNSPNHQSLHYGFIGAVVFKAKAPGMTALAYDFGQTAISAKGSGSSNMLNRVMPLTLNILDTTATPTPTQSPTPTPIVLCAQDAKLCPDGSYVSRIPPTCQFAPCSTTITPTPTLTQFSAYDLNKDGLINILDYALFIPEFGKNNSNFADFDNTGTVDIFDYNLFVENYPLNTPTPTPTLSQIPTCGNGICDGGACTGSVYAPNNCTPPENYKNCPQDCKPPKVSPPPPPGCYFDYGASKNNKCIKAPCYPVDPVLICD